MEKNKVLPLLININSKSRRNSRVIEVPDRAVPIRGPAFVKRAKGQRSTWVKQVTQVRKKKF